MSDENVTQTSVGLKAGDAHLKELQEIAEQAQRLEMTAFVQGTEGRVKLSLSCEHGQWVSIQAPGMHKVARTVSAGLVDLSKLGKELMLDSITAKATKSKVTGKALKRIAIAAWCEAADLPIPSEEEMKQLLSMKQPTAAELRKQLVDRLRSSESPAQLLTSLSDDEISEIKNLKNTDFSHLNLSGADFHSLDLDGSNFDGANLEKARLTRCTLKHTSFKQVNLQKGVLEGAKLHEANFTGANLKDANIASTVLSGTIFSQTDLSDADLSYADLRQSDLSTATLAGTLFCHTYFDEQTKFPANFGYPEGLSYLGTGVDPVRIARLKSEAAANGALDFETFLERLKQNSDIERVKKALKMLQAESFQLFSQVHSDSLIGVVKSQTDPDLVYSCRLTDSGSFSCCTQNLFPCGGLRGALCKHLMVLLVGLTRAGELDATTACEWVLASRIQKPNLNKDIMSETFLRYKGAEAGEIDWRPTETMPEDYYAF